jgi:hypothetical protein
MHQKHTPDKYGQKTRIQSCKYLLVGIAFLTFFLLPGESWAPPYDKYESPIVNHRLYGALSGSNAQAAREKLLGPSSPVLGPSPPILNKPFIPFSLDKTINKPIYDLEYEYIRQYGMPTK